ncbi:MAG: cyclase family protein [Pseudomonadota bacterium]|nr:cyclase family protein [Pseudomonadota bacterium]
MKVQWTVAAAAILCLTATSARAQQAHPLWELYANTFKAAKYVDLTHAFEPMQPVWPGFGQAVFQPAIAGQDLGDYAKKGDEFTYDKHGFIATAYELSTDQYGTQLDPPAHWDKLGATISDLPASFTLRPLVVIDIHDKVVADPGYHATIDDVKAWETEHGTVPEGAVVMFRSDWHKKWSDTATFAKALFPGVKLDTLQFLHNERRILFHGHEPLDTDTTPTLEGEAWLMHNHFAQAEGVANLDQVPEAGALLAIDFAKPKGGVGGYARYLAICPPDWQFGVSVIDAPGAPLPKQANPLKRNAEGVLVPTP